MSYSTQAYINQQNPDMQQRAEGAFTGRIRVLSENSQDFGRRIDVILHNLRGASPPAPATNSTGPGRQTCIEDYLGQAESANKLLEDMLSEMERLIG